MNKDISSFIQHVTQRLSSYPLDFQEKMRTMDCEKHQSRAYLSAGVCMPFYYYSGEFHVQLIKRSIAVSQPGDLSFPGGMLSPIQDYFLKSLLCIGLIPALSKNPDLQLSKRDDKTRRLMLLFLANAIREAWEEVRLNPFNIIYLGSLPTYDLKIFRRIIFPSVCFISRKSHYQTNNEVESLLHIPLPYFFDQSNYYRLHVDISDSTIYQEDFPCLHFVDKAGQDHVLWGATFFMIMRFLDIVFDFKIPALQPEKIINKTLLPDYHRRD